MGLVHLDGVEKKSRLRLTPWDCVILFHRESEAPKLPPLEVTAVSKCLISASLDQSGGAVWSPVTLGIRGRAMHISGRSGGRPTARGTPSQVTQPTRPELLGLWGK